MNVLIRKNVFWFMMTFLFLSGFAPARADSAAPDFAIDSLDHGKISLSQYLGRWVVLDFWSVTCAPCKAAIPELNRLQKKYQAQGLMIIGINVDRPERVGNNLLRDYKKFFTINYILARADQKILAAYFPGQKKYNLPASFIIDPRGRMVKTYEGFDSGLIEKDLAECLK